MDIHYISCGYYCIALRICRSFPVYPFCHGMTIHMMPVNTTDQLVKLIRREMPCGITFPGPSEGSPVQGAGTQPYAMSVPPENFYAGVDFVVLKTKAVPSCHAALSSSRTYCVRVSMPRRISTGFTTRNTLSVVSSGNPTPNERIRLYGISEREKQSDALRAVWRFEIQIQEQGVLVQRVLRRYGG